MLLHSCLPCLTCIRVWKVSGSVDLSCLISVFALLMSRVSCVFTCLVNTSRPFWWQVSTGSASSRLSCFRHSLLSQLNDCTYYQWTWQEHCMYVYNSYLENCSEDFGKTSDDSLRTAQNSSSTINFNCKLIFFTKNLLCVCTLQGAHYL